MQFVKYINSLKGKVAVFVDMDGVIADYDNDPQFDKYSEGFYLKKRPIKTTIEIFKKISENKNITLYLLSGHADETEALKTKEKNIWIDQNAPFFQKENRIFNSPKNISADGIRRGKAWMIEELTKNNNFDHIIQIDDDVRVIKGTNKHSQGKVTIFHVISILD